MYTSGFLFMKASWRLLSRGFSAKREFAKGGFCWKDEDGSIIKWGKGGEFMFFYIFS